MKSSFVPFVQFVRDLWLRANIFIWLGLSSSFALAQTSGGGSFTDRVKNAQSVSGERLNTKIQDNVNYAYLALSALAAIIGFALFIAGVMRIRKAAQDESGRESSLGGWISAICGGVLGASGVVFMLFVGFAASFGN